MSSRKRLHCKQYGVVAYESFRKSLIIHKEKQKELMFNVSFISDIDTAKLYLQFLRSQTCSRLGLLTVEATLPSSCLVRSFQLLYLGLSVFAFISCLQNVHFSMTMLPPNIRIFAIFLQFFKLLSQQIEVYMIMLSVQLSSFELRGFIFHAIHKKNKEEVRAIDLFSLYVLFSNIGPRGT